MSGLHWLSKSPCRPLVSSGWLYTSSPPPCTVWRYTAPCVNAQSMETTCGQWRPHTVNGDHVHSQWQPHVVDSDHMQSMATLCTVNGDHVHSQWRPCAVNGDNVHSQWQPRAQSMATMCTVNGDHVHSQWRPHVTVFLHLYLHEMKSGCKTGPNHRSNLA